VSDYEAIRRLIALYGQLLDSRRFAEWGELFAPDASFAFWGRTLSGRDEIVREIGGMQPPAPGKHVVLQPVIDLDDATHARAWTDLSAFATTKRGIEIVTIGRYHDRLVKQDERWHIAARALVMGGEAPPPGFDPPPAR